MADIKISALPAASTPLTGAEVLPIVQSSVTTKVAVSNLTAGLSGTASININGTVGATTAAAGAFTTLSATGLITNTLTSGEAFKIGSSTAGTGVLYMDMFNTSGGLYLGLEGSAGGTLWTGIPAYATGLGGRNGGGGISFSANAITQHMLLTTTGLAVTGTLSATSTSTLAAVNASGAITTSDTTASTSAITGSIKTAGGIGVLKGIFAGSSSSRGTIDITGTSGAGPSLTFNDNQSGAQTYITGAVAANEYDIFDSTRGAYVLRATNTGAVTIPGTLGVTGKITATAAGIDVPTSNLGMVSSGTYTPTLFNTTNIDASTAFVCQYIRVGNVVTVSGNVNIDFTAAAQTSLGMSLPIASNFANANELGGVASSGVATLNILGILADTTNDRAQFDGLTAATINTAMRFSFTYLIV